MNQYASADNMRLQIGDRPKAASGRAPSTGRKLCAACCALHPNLILQVAASSDFIFNCAQDAGPKVVKDNKSRFAWTIRPPIPIFRPPETPCGSL